MSDFEEGVDILNVDLPELEDLDRGRMIVENGKVAASNDKREAIFDAENLVKGTMDS